MAEHHIICLQVLVLKIVRVGAYLCKNDNFSTIGQHETSLSFINQDVVLHVQTPRGRS